ncbi:hypothetical protein EGH21_15480 [Halomicroarcula sp. F13]|uniref:Halobacterial output domain-containing protein n=1 Tax=Haloarcula rubra TaxID=2487747 RepID=A0AAW4PT71_9EURY|nr:hypothetical protein [Halomicroarcula rubra]
MNGERTSIAEHRCRHEWGGDTALTTTILDGISHVVGDKNYATERPLYDVIDPDALNSVFEPAPESDRAAGGVRFRFAGCDVRVAAGGEVLIEQCGSEQSNSPSPTSW